MYTDISNKQNIQERKVKIICVLQIKLKLKLNINVQRRPHAFYLPKRSIIVASVSSSGQGMWASSL